MSTRLDIELGASLLLDLTYKRGDEVRTAKNVHAAFVGVEHGQYIAVRLTADPIEKYHYFFSNLGDIIVKYILKGKAYAFTTRLISKTEKPMAILFLTYPEAVETMSLRKEERARCHPVALVEAKGKEYRGQLYDISQTGCRVDLLEGYSEHTHHLAKDEKVRFSFYLPGIAECTETESIIKWSRPISDNWCVGLRFTALGAEELARIDGFLKSVRRS